MSDDLPEAFVRLRNLVHVHLKQILKIPKKHPIHATALLVLVACEALSKLLGRGDDDIFVEEYLGRWSVPHHVGEGLFSALRNGLAHVYTPYPVVLGGVTVWPLMMWAGLPTDHLRIVRTRHVKGHQHIVPVDEGTGPLRLSLVVKCMVEDLDSLFAELEDALRESPKLRATVDRNAKTFRLKTAPRPQGPALSAWREFVRQRQWRSDG